MKHSSRDSCNVNAPAQIKRRGKKKKKKKRERKSDIFFKEPTHLPHSPQSHNLTNITSYLTLLASHLPISFASFFFSTTYTLFPTLPPVHSIAPPPPSFFQQSLQENFIGKVKAHSSLLFEVLNGNPYNRKCDVYSFGIRLWEIYCCDMPYPDLSFSEVTTAVVRQNLRPEIPRCCPSSLANVMKRCWDASPDKRPEMEEVVSMLEAIDTSKVEV